MRQKRLNWLANWLSFLLAVVVGVAEAQTIGDTRLQIRLRASDGTAVVGETVILERLPEEAPILPQCTTTAQGECTWYVGSGLYQVLFTRPLDNISALAVAEGGLRGLGVTVGDEDIGDASIAYHFTFHSDGRVYFDAAPEAAVPSPIIPVGHMLQGGIAPAPTPSPQPEQPVDVTTTRLPELTVPEDSAASSTSSNSWRLILFIGGGLVIGGGFHRWSRHRQRPSNRQSEPPHA